MKYLFLALAAGIFLMGCNSNMAKASKNPTTDESSENLKPKQIINVTEEQQLLKFIGPNNQTYILRTTDNFETAELSDQSGKTYRLKRAVSASGLRLANSQGISIHFKNGEGILELIKDQPINVTEVKP
ncbi:hypothetical protein [Acinetobacter radioresistens]|uniref:hypothetical protein n=1 Tax=Acinetobacter radioresistens TaxID=40216 RepID=UPI003212F2CB